MCTFFLVIRGYWVKIRDLMKFFNEWAPEIIAEEYDNVGLQIGDRNLLISNVIISLDVTFDVVKEAISKHANLIITHHPLIFKPLKSITNGTYVERLVEELIRNRVALYAMHTNLDSVIGGINYRLGDILGLEEISFLSQNENGFGMGVIGRLSIPMDFKDFLAAVKSKLEIPVLRIVGDLNTKVQTIAICGGAGGMLLEDAIKKDADVFITSDIKYHTFYDALGSIALVDAGHFETEFPIVETIHNNLSTWLKDKNENIDVFISGACKNPITYF